ncbi:hypothetical protein KI387_044080 [Taxus chinensis]|uniref:Uncharacterized protein n=1 Tax=Taxus chinensis TaxID=29808 RepID=A0AA38L6H7_TAXCH|nr:hypothetical protein KI387_044080 [Taxus chinensis]
MPLQLILALWQIIKLTPLWAVLSCTMSWLIMTLFPCLSCCCPDNYILRKKSDGRVFKKVVCYVTTPVHDLAPSPANERLNSKNHDLAPSVSPAKEKPSKNSVQINYLDRKFTLKRKFSLERNLGQKLETRVEVNGKEYCEEGDKLCKDNFILEPKDGDKLYVNDVLKYYVTDEIWHSILRLEEACGKKEVGDKRKVFIKNHKEIWEEVVTGCVMSVDEVLDSVILDQHTVSRLDHEYFLPKDITSSEDKILKVLNVVGLFLQSHSHNQKHIHWIVPALLSLTSLVMGFSTQLMCFVYGKIRMLCCTPIQLLCDHLDDFSWRRQVYSLGNWIENLKPSNDLQSKIVWGDVRALVAGGAKVTVDCATLFEIQGAFKLPQRKDSFKCGTFYIN